MEATNDNDLQYILTSFKNKKISYDEAAKKLDVFSKEGLIWWILNPFDNTANFKDFTQRADLLSEHQKSLPKDNPYNDIKM